jgi:copper transporter 1
MLFTWDTTDLCIVFPSWHISGTGSLIISLLAVILLTAGYEAVREISRRYETYASKVMEGPRGEFGASPISHGQQGSNK